MLLLRELAVTTVLVLAGSANASFYPKNSDVLVLDHKNFKNEILHSDNAAVSLPSYFCNCITRLYSLILCRSLSKCAAPGFFPYNMNLAEEDTER